MTQYSLSPAFVKLQYNYNTLREHIMTLAVRPSGSPVVGSQPNVLLADDSVEGFIVAIDDFVDALKPLFGNTTTFGIAEFWSQPTPDDDPIWIYSYDTSETGTSASANVALLQTTMTFRTQAGHMMKTVLLECPGTPNFKDTTPWAGAYATFATFMKSDDNLAVGRDGSRAVATITVTNKTNDALRKKYFLT